MEGLDGNEAEEEADITSPMIQSEKRIYQSMISKELSHRETAPSVSQSAVSSVIPRTKQRFPSLYIPKMSILIMAVGTR